MNDDITRILSDAVPEDPDTSSWPERIQRRSRRRKAGMAVGALTVVAVLAVPVGLFVANQLDSRIPATPASPAPTGPPPTGENPCEDLLERMRDGDDVTTGLPDGSLPENPTRAWLCGDPQQPWSGPAEPLSGDLDEVIAAFNGYESLPPDTACTEEYAMQYLTVLDYEETSVVVRGELHGCKVLTAHDDRRVGGDIFLELLTERWLEQREHPRSAVTEADCDAAQGTLLPAGIGALISGFRCTAEGEPAGEPLSADLLTRISESLNSGDLYPTSYVDLEDDSLVLADVWGATIGLTPHPAGGFLVNSGTPFLYPYQRWAPPSDLEAEVTEWFEAVS